MTWHVDADRRTKGLYWQRALGLVGGCTPVSPACDGCWAAGEAHMRAANPNAKVAAANAGLTCPAGHFNGTVRVRMERLKIPTPRQRPAVWAVWTDLFHEKVPGPFINKALQRMKECPQHTFLICTKRAERMAEFFNTVPGRDASLPNVVLMVTAENQVTADERIPQLLRCEGWRKGLSCEPLLGPLDLSKWLHGRCTRCGDDHAECACTFSGTSEEATAEAERCTGSAIDWITCGGESGSKARPSHPEWFRSLRDQCKAAGVPFHFKQWGEWGWGENHHDFKDESPMRDRHGCFATHSHRLSGLRCGEFEIGCTCGGEQKHMVRVGKKEAGRYLDGKLHDGFPEVADA